MRRPDRSKPYRLLQAIKPHLVVSSLRRLVLAAYGVAFAVAGTLLAVRRDVT
jgi:hypothetical protein